jgi:aspartate kinase
MLEFASQGAKVLQTRSVEMAMNHRVRVQVLSSFEDKPGIAARIFVPLAEASINVDMIVQNISEDGRYTDMTFTVASAELPRAMEVLRPLQDEIRFSDLRGSTGVVKVSVIGVGMRSHAGAAAQMFQALAEKGINIQAISTSEIKISVLIDEAYTELAVRTLHTLFGLDQ